MKSHVGITTIMLMLIMTFLIDPVVAVETKPGPRGAFVVSKKQAEKDLATLKHLAAIKRPAASTVDEASGGTLVMSNGHATAKIEDNCIADEAQFEDVSRGVLWNLKEAILRRDGSLLQASLGKDFKGTNWGWQWKKERISADVHESRADISKNRVDASGLLGGVKAYVEKFDAVDYVDAVALKYLSSKSERKSDMSMSEMRVQLRLDVRGHSGNSRMQDTGLLNLRLTLQDGRWLIKTLDVDSWSRVAKLKTPLFTEVTTAGLSDQIPSYLRTEAIRRGGYALAVGDYNGDGISDLYVGADGPGVLLKGLSGGRFEAESKLSSQDTYVKTAIFNDFDNDGDQDLLMVRFVPTPSKSYDSDKVLYVNEEGSFRRMVPPKNKVKTRASMPATVADFNGDGKLDFYIGFPGAKDFTTFGFDTQAGSVEAQGLYVNQGNLAFKSVFSSAFDEGNVALVSHRQRLWPHSALAADFDQDGDMDILVVDDRGQLSPMYQNDGTGKFKQVAEVIGVTNQGYGMGAAIGDLDNDGVYDILMTNVTFEQNRRMHASCAANWDTGNYVDVVDHGLKIFRGMRNGRYAEVSSALPGLESPGFGLAGVELLDYNNDGKQDIYVTNGLWSGNNPREDMGSLYTRSKMINSDTNLQRPIDAKNQTQSLVMRILAGFKGDVEKQKWDGVTRPHLAGFQRNRLYRNNGDGSFTDVAYVEGVDSEADGYVVAKADIDGDGDLDLILRNGDPGSKDVSYAPVQIFRNDSQKTIKALRLKLVSTSGNRDAIGSEVVVTTPDKVRQIQHLVSNNGAAQSERMLHFGLGTSSRADVRIRWPNGHVQVIKGLSAGFHQITEKKPLFEEKLSALEAASREGAVSH